MTVGNIRMKVKDGTFTNGSSSTFVDLQANGISYSQEGSIGVGASLNADIEVNNYDDAYISTQYMGHKNPTIEISGTLDEKAAQDDSTIINFDLLRRFIQEKKRKILIEPHMFPGNGVYVHITGIEVSKSSQSLIPKPSGGWDSPTDKAKSIGGIMDYTMTLVVDSKV